MYSIFKYFTFFYGKGQRKSKRGDKVAGLTGDIERFLKALLESTGEGFVEIGRNDLANRFDCSPSQINYVLSTRFTPYNGYLIESKRGGNGFIKIIAIIEDEENYIKYIIKNLDKDMTQAKAQGFFLDLYNKEYLDRKEYKLACYATSDKALKNVDYKNRNLVRHDIVRNILLSFLLRS